MSTEIIRVAIQGIKASFHDEAARKYFEKDIEIVECKTFKDSCMALEKKEVDYTIMAIENSLAGSLLGNYSLLQEHDFYIIGEVTIAIQLHLMALPGVKFSDIKYVQSHPIAIRQCVEYFYSYPDIQIVEKFDTAACAKEIKDKGLKDTAAIANFAAAGLYGLDFLEKRIETNKKNYTRFLVLSRTKIDIPDANKASLVFQVKDDIGTLAKVLEIFAQHRLNLSKIQSMPVLGKPSRYNFYVDLNWAKDGNYPDAISGILAFTSNLTEMGLYKNNHLIA